jgi:hypothetical protein
MILGYRRTDGQTDRHALCTESVFDNDVFQYPVALLHHLYMLSFLLKEINSKLLFYLLLLIHKNYKLKYLLVSVSLGHPQATVKHTKIVTLH